MQEFNARNSVWQSNGSQDPSRAEFSNAITQVAKKLGVDESLVSIKVWSTKGYNQEVKTRGESFIINQ